MRIIGGVHKGRKLQPPRAAGVRPTTDYARESLMALIENRIELSETRVLDLFGGTGAVSFELASRGALSVTTVEMKPRLVGFIREQAALLNLPIAPIRADAFRWLKKPGMPFGLIFADPPYNIQHHEDIPNFVFDGGWLNENGWLIVEHDKKIDFSQHPHFESQRSYGAVQFSFFTKAI